MMSHVSKQVPGEPTKEKLKTEKFMKKETIRNIILSLIGSFMFGLGIDLRLVSISFLGISIIIVSIILSIITFNKREE